MVLRQGDTVRKQHLVGSAVLTDRHRCNPQHSCFLNTPLHLLEVLLFEYKNCTTRSGVCMCTEHPESEMVSQSKWANRCCSASQNVDFFQIIYCHWSCIRVNIENICSCFICSLFISCNNSRMKAQVDLSSFSYLNTRKTAFKSITWRANMHPVDNIEYLYIYTLCEFCTIFKESVLFLCILYLF